jgi:hypothetical protein
LLLAALTPARIPGGEAPRMLDVLAAVELRGKDGGKFERPRDPD